MLQEHTNMIGNVDFYCEMTVSLVYFSHSFLFQLQINENNRNINSHKQIKINLVRIINCKSAGTLNFITWKEKDHITQERNTN